MRDFCCARARWRHVEQSTCLSSANVKRKKVASDRSSVLRHLTVRKSVKMKPESSGPPDEFKVASQESLFADPVMFPRNSLSQPLEDIDEELPICLPLSLTYPPPDTPEEPMEFLSRSWSISALEVAKALAPCTLRTKREPNEQQTLEESALVTAPFAFASAVTAQIVMDRMMAISDVSPFASRRNSHSGGGLNLSGNGLTGGSRPLSPKLANELSFCRSFSGIRGPLRGMSMRRWLKDLKERKKEAARSQKAQLHAAMSVAGVAAAVAAIAAATANSAGNDNQTKTSAAVASAAALVAAQCVEVAESMGADCDQISSVVSSAVNVRSPGDVMTLTAAAATALRGAATLKARILKDTYSTATVIPYEKGPNSVIKFSRQLGSEDSEVENCHQDFLRRGHEFLKRTRKGELHWRIVVVYINKHSQVVVKSKGKYMGGTITKNKKRIVLDVYGDIPAWPGRDVLDNGEERRYFGIKTVHGVMELECRNEADHRLWTEGILRLLSLSKHQRQR